RRTIRGAGLPRYAAACLLAGYAWLGVAGALWAATGLSSGRYLYDAALHALFLGFVISMVFGHAPVILPAVLRVRLPYRPILYAPRSEEHTSELQSRENLVCRLLLDKNNFLSKWTNCS